PERWLPESDPVGATEALHSVEAAGRDALGELDALMSTLDGSPPQDAEPLPAGGRPSVASLIDGEVLAGMRVELVTHGEPRGLDAGIELSLYRIVQEALTNVRKHAPGANARVELIYAPDGVQVEVSDSGRPPATTVDDPVPGAGQGLVGIEERASLFGGHAEAGPTPGG